MELKYVRSRALGFIIWPRTDDVWHSHIGKLMRERGHPIMSAGFASVSGGYVRCWGESESLGIGSDKSDSEALANQLELSVVGRLKK